MNTHPDIEGIEFDWFAADRIGNIALFATAGSGFMPESVISVRAEHQAMSESFDAPHWGSDNVWDDYARLGFFVFDWSLHDGPYLRVRAPTDRLSEQLSAKLKGLTVLPQLAVDFQSCTSISEGEFPNAT